MQRPREPAGGRGRGPRLSHVAVVVVSEEVHCTGRGDHIGILLVVANMCPELFLRNILRKYMSS